MADTKAAPAVGKQPADAAKSPARPVLGIASGKPAEAAPSKPAPAPKPAQPVPTATWSDEDEAALAAMMARRKAAGYRRRGKDVGAQPLGRGEIKPNAGTVAAAIVDLMGSRESVTRSELIDLMGSGKFSHPNARPKQVGWSQGYVAGLIRNGFLIVLDSKPADAGA
jgi:hypothetical protein